MNSTLLLVIGGLLVALVLKYGPSRQQVRAHLAAPRRAAFPAFLLLVLIVVVACEGDGTGSGPVPDWQINADAHTRLLAQAMKDVGFNPKQITTSVELENLLTRIKRENDPNRVGYVYFFSADGKVVYYSKIYGKCSSSNSLPTAPDSVKVSSAGTAGVSSTDQASAQLDGSYGSNEPGVFCFRYPDRAMIKWSGVDFESDTYIPLTTQPVLNQACSGLGGCQP